MGGIWLLSLIGHMYLNGVIRCVYMNIHHKDTCLKEIRLCLQILLTTQHLTFNKSEMGEETYVSN